MKQNPFDWDDEKAATNLKKHGVAFEEAKGALYDPLAFVAFDTRHSETEDRWITIGYSNKKRFLTVVSTYRGENIRIISARRATKDEIKTYEEYNT